MKKSFSNNIFSQQNFGLFIGNLFIGNIASRQYPLFYLYALAVIFELECEGKILQMPLAKLFHFDNEQDTQVR